LKGSFVLHTSYREQVEALTMEQRGLLLTAIMAHADGEPPPELDAVTGMCFGFIRRQMDKDAGAYAARCEKNRENASKRWDAIACDRINRNASESGRIVSHYDNDYDNDLKENHSPKGECQKKSARRFTPPTLQEVTAYVAEKGYNVDPERFVDYYAARGWKIKGDSMKDWKAAVRNWHRTQRQDEPPKRPQGQEKTAQANRFINYQQRDVDLDAIITQQERKSLGRV